MQRQVCITREWKLAKSQPLTVTKSTTNYYANGNCSAVYVYFVSTNLSGKVKTCRTVYFVLFEPFHAANVYTVFL